MKLFIGIGALLLCCFFTCTVCAQTKKAKAECTGNDACCKKTDAKASKALACKLTSPELRLRKETVIKSLKSQVITKTELKNGYQYKFEVTDKMIDELAEFIKTERACCDFFTFNLSFSGDKKHAILQITGPAGTKEFIKSELEM